MSPIKRLTPELWTAIAEQASQSPRLRQNYNFHQEQELVQRFLNVLQPGTYVRPHRHLPETNGFEFFLVLQGELGLLILDAQGTILQQERISATGDTRGLELAAGTYHTLVALAPNTVMFELKQGPYQPLTDKDFLPQFPLEGTGSAQAWVKVWEQAFQNGL